MNPSNPLAPHVAAKLEPGDLLTDREAAAILGVALQTMRNWRYAGAGPRTCKIGKRLVRYRRADLLDFIEGRERAA